jgi:hypothetical protein
MLRVLTLSGAIARLASQEFSARKVDALSIPMAL